MPNHRQIRELRTFLTVVNHWVGRDAAPDFSLVIFVRNSGGYLTLSFIFFFTFCSVAAADNLRYS